VLPAAVTLRPAGAHWTSMRRALGALAFALAALPQPGRAEQRPLWEAGVGPLGFYLPDYRGSDEGRSYLYPFPFFVYRGEHLKVDREGIRSIFFHSERVELDVSMYATQPVDSQKNRARLGMPDLDATVEIGPVLGIVLARDREIDYSYRLRLRLPVRAVVATDFRHWQSQGWVAYPHLNLDLRPHVFGGLWNVGFSAGPLFGTQKFHQYFYGVAPQFAAPDRPAYEARGGYSGTAMFASVSRHFGKVWMGAYLRYDLLRGAAFEPSPLVRQDTALAGGIAIAWVFSASGTTVETPD
jgi:outer membrane scaffolding protein for murein synthesis (MipA/OmpV family)